MITVSYFSAGVSSAVATKLMIDDIDIIMYTHIDDHHHDNTRFISDCESWFGKPIERMQHPLLKSIDSVCRFGGFIKSRNGGAPCTSKLKRFVRKQFERDYENQLRIVWGFDCTEKKRCDRIRLAMPNHKHLFPLVDKRYTKSIAHQILKASGIKRPLMYDLGYHNNNCIGCIKGGMGYWNKIRIDFPEVFRSRSILERAIGFPIIGKDIWLDELDPIRGRHNGPICESCGIACQLFTTNNLEGLDNGSNCNTNT